MPELAFNMSGEPFEVPNRAVGWRVRRMKPKGAPEVVYGRNGLPLVLPIDAEVDDLRHEANAAGRYRLDPVGDDNKPIEYATAAYVFIHEDRTPAIPECVTGGDRGGVDRAGRPSATALLSIDPKTMTHVLAIPNALQPSEAAMARTVAADLPPLEVRAGFDELTTLSVPDAVTKIRSLIGSEGAS